MKAVIPAVLCAVLLAASPALAHRVNIFAFVDQEDVVVECAFNKSSKVKNGGIEVYDAVTRDLLVRGTTDQQGTFRFPLPQQARAARHDLAIRVIAGEGHQNEWIVGADEYPAAGTTSSPAPAQAAGGAPEPDRPASAPLAGQTVAAPAVSSAPPASPAGEALPPAAAAPLTRTDVEGIIRSELAAQLAPLKRGLAAAQESGPSLRDIIGGIGWLLGLCGIAAYFRRKQPHV